MTHRCPGEWITVMLIAEATRRLLRLPYDIGPAAMESPPFRYPPPPRDGFLMRNLTRLIADTTQPESERQVTGSQTKKCCSCE